MITELGHFALILALFVAVVQASVPLVGAQRQDGGLMRLGDAMAVLQLLLVGGAFLALVHAYVTSDFSVLNVAQNSHSLKPMLYKVTGVWGNHEGSLLLWILILALFGAAVALFGTNLPPRLRARTLAVQAMIGVGFLLFTLLTSNPFERVSPAPLDGNDLNPLLQDPGLAFHPPLLYAGYVGLSIVFSFAIAALIEGRIDAAWARWVRPWTLLAWVFLTLGIALGSWWAYYELGWGGWWYWDPVENASFMPWLVATALLHSAIVVEKRDTLKSWTVLLAIVAFSFSLIGTFLVRSGVLTSVHAFANDPDRGVFILGFLLVAIGGSLTLYAWRAPALQAGGLFQPVSRESGLVLNNLFLSIAAATVFLGTLYPLFLEALGGGKVSVGAPYFNATFIPLMTPLLLLMAVGPLLPWKRADLRAALSRLRYAGLLTIAVVIATLALSHGRALLGALGLGLATWLAAGVVVELAGRAGLAGRTRGNGPRDVLRRLRGLPRAAYGMSLAHLGVAVLVLGITASSVWQSEVIRVMAPGDTAEVGGYELRFEGAQGLRGPNYLAERGRFVAMADGEEIAVLTPERRRYLVGGRETVEAAIAARPLGDLYVVLGERAGADRAAGAYGVRLYFEPFIHGIWLGTLLMSLGGLLSLSDRRLRVGAPQRRREPVGTAAPVRVSGTP